MPTFSRLAIALAIACSSHAVAAATYLDLPIAGAKDHAFDNQGVLYVTAGTSVYRYDTTQCLANRAFKLGSDLQGIDLSPSGRWIAVADRGINKGQVHFYLYDLEQGQVDQYGPVPQRVDYPAASGENGSFMVTWGGDDSLLISGSYAGSGWVPLRRYDPVSGAMTTLGNVRQNTMLSTSGDGGTIAIAEWNSSAGDVGAIDVPTATKVAAKALNRYVYEIATDALGERYVVPGYSGASVLQRSGSTFNTVATIGQYATWGPTSVAFVQGGTQFISADWGNAANAGIKLYDATTLQMQKRIDNIVFPWTGFNALSSGRITLSPDARWLAATTANGVRLYDLLDEPIVRPSGPLAAGGNCTTTQASSQTSAVQRPSTTTRFDADGWPISSGDTKK